MPRMLFILTVLMCFSPALADEKLEALVQQALDQPTNIEIKDAPLAEAIEKIARETGVSLVVGPQALNALPYGEQTRVGVRLANVSLRAGIDAICQQLAMRYEVRNRSVELLPCDALVRLGRRATWEELSTISGLMRTHWLAGTQQWADLRNKVQFHNSPEGQQLSWDALAEQLNAAGAGSAYDVFTQACESLDATWYPWGEQIIVLPLYDQTIRQMQQTVSLRYAHAPLSDVLRGLSRQIGVRIVLDPRSAMQLPLAKRESFNVVAEGVTAEEALQQISIATGLTYDVVPGAVTLFMPSAEDIAAASTGAGANDIANVSTRTMQASSDASSRPRDPIVGAVMLPPGPDGSQMQIFIRESDLTEEELALRQKAIEKAREAMRTALLDDAE